ncbi:MAG: DNA mismatch repair endonuclease MutL, partial [Clostridia bacterium]|nr:DNA mismatch repair endonuclease MutL [Clostridia bacterium]
MPKINVLSFEVANLIAAGEVVDRPSSAVKELLENALDAGATMVTVEIQRGGITFMRIADNGCGIAPDDMPTAIRRHATSKIATAADLDGITTLGFRGEALAAIAAVSRLRIYSKTADSPYGMLLEAEGGEIKNLVDVGCTEGTTIIVEDLFFNVPARRKFLKKDSTESTAVAAAVEKIALSHPEVSIRFICDGEIKFVTSGKGDLQETIWALFGRENAKRSLRCDREENGIRVSGFVCEPDLCRSNRSMENFFINGRYIKSKTAAAALEQAYSSKIPSDKFPFCVLNIELNPAAVDVNVHPAKLEVKFANEKLIFDAVYYAVLSALEADAKRPEFALPQSAPAKSNPYISPAAQVSLKNAFRPMDQRPKTGEQVRLSDIPADPSPLKKLIKAVRDAKDNPVVQEKLPVPETVPDEATPAEPPVPDEIPAQKPLAKSYDKPYVPPLVPPESKLPPLKVQDNGVIPQKEIPPHEIIEVTVDRPDPEPERDNPVLPPVPKSAPSVYIPDEIKPGDIPEYNIIGEAFNCYVIVQIADRILMIDKHAAHERIIFDELSRQMRANIKNGTKNGQMVLVPLTVTVLAAEADAMEDYREKVEALGFAYTFEQTGAAMFQASVTQIPEQLDNTSALELFSSLAIKLANQTGSVESAAEGFFETRLWQSACKAAVKGGRIYDMGHIKWICDRLLKKPGQDNQVIRTCPHGRPVAFEIKKSSIDRQFARLG